MVLAPKKKLNNGEEMPILGLGTYMASRNECETAVKWAIDCGYRHIDTAYVYNNEEEIGRAIHAKINEGVVKREDLFIVTKLAGEHHGPEVVEHACRTSLQSLGLDYVDLYLIHFPAGTGSFLNVDYVDTWKAMESLVKKKLVRSIGVSNFNSEQIERVLQTCEIKPVTNQVECHPGFNQKKLIEFCRQREIVITAYSPLGRLDPTNKRPSFIFDRTIGNLAKSYSKTPAQVVLRYSIQNGTVVIPKSVTKSRIEENFQVFDFELTEEEMKLIDRYNRGIRLIPFDGMRKHKYYPFNIEF